MAHITDRIENKKSIHTPNDIGETGFRYINNLQNDNLRPKSHTSIKIPNPRKNGAKRAISRPDTSPLSDVCRSASAVKMKPPALSPARKRYMAMGHPHVTSFNDFLLIVPFAPQPVQQKTSGQEPCHPFKDLMVLHHITRYGVG